MTPVHLALLAFFGGLGMAAALWLAYALLAGLNSAGARERRVR